MTRFTFAGFIGFACLMPLMGCVVAPQPGPPPPAYIAPAPVIVAPPLVVGRPHYYRRWYHGRRPYWRHRYHR
jgi:hypothetical protein